MSPLQEHITQYIRGLLQQANSEHTVLAYQKDLEQFRHYLHNTYAIDHPKLIKPLHIRSWLVELLSDEAYKLKASSVKRKKSAIQSFLKYLVYQKVITNNPASAVPAPRMPKRLPVTVGAECVEKLVDLGTQHNPNPTWQQRNELLIIKLLFETGMRRAELIGLDIKDIDFYRKSISVLGKGNKHRVIPLHPDTLQLIQEYLDERGRKFGHSEGSLLVTSKGNPVGEKYVYRVCKKYLLENSTAHKQSPHVLRHTFATELLNNGADIMAIKELLGHKNLSATQIYTHTQIENLKKEFRKFHPRS